MVRVIVYHTGTHVIGLVFPTLNETIKMYTPKSVFFFPEIVRDFWGHRLSILTSLQCDPDVSREQAEIDAKKILVEKHNLKLDEIEIDESESTPNSKEMFTRFLSIIGC